MRAARGTRSCIALFAALLAGPACTGSETATATVFPDSRGRLRLDSVMLQRVHLSDTRFCIGGPVAAGGAFREKRIRQRILLVFADGNQEQGK